MGWFEDQEAVRCFLSGDSFLTGLTSIPPTRASSKDGIAQPLLSASAAFKRRAASFSSPPLQRLHRFAFSTRFQRTDSETISPLDSRSQPRCARGCFSKRHSDNASPSAFVRRKKRKYMYKYGHIWAYGHYICTYRHIYICTWTHRGSGRVTDGISLWHIPRGHMP